GVRLQINGRGR
ncbi:hypothetical protein BA03_03814, partial [Mycobacterium tuberculosis NRITLD44]